MGLGRWTPPEEMDVRAAAAAAEAGRRRAGAEGTHHSAADVHGGHNGYDPHPDGPYDPSSDLYLYSRPVSEFWETQWKRTPLVLHDKDLIDASRYIRDDDGVALRKDHAPMDLTREITSILSNHPGPVSCLRVDSSALTGLSEWMHAVSSKGIECLTVLNPHAGGFSFPVSSLQSPALRSLSLGFVHITGLGIGAFEYSSLTALRLLGCTYDGQALSAVVSECSSLKKLVIGCSAENVRIISQSLVSVKLWNCTAASCVIEYAPKLRVFAPGVKPRNGSHSAVVDVNGAHALTELYYLMLPYHSFTIRSASVTNEGLICLPSVRKLRLGIAMADAYQRSGLVKVLQRLPNLADLGVWRMDEVDPGEASDVTVDGPLTTLRSLQCVRFSLRYLLMEGFRGGHAEIAVISRILGHAPNLIEVSIEPDVVSREHASVAAFELQNCPRASKGCQITFQSSTGK